MLKKHMADLEKKLKENEIYAHKLKEEKKVD
jgi:hypothetical protein